MSAAGVTGRRVTLTAECRQRKGWEVASRSRMKNRTTSNSHVFGHFPSGQVERFADGTCPTWPNGKGDDKLASGPPTPPEVVSSQMVFDALNRSELLRDWIAAFHQLTGLTIRLVPIQSPGFASGLSSPVNAFCRQAGSFPATACPVTPTFSSQAPERLSCPAGLAEVAVPILVAGKHAATLLCGQVFVRKPNCRAWPRIATRLCPAASEAELTRLRKLWTATKVVPPKILETAVTALVHFARLVGECAAKWVLAPHQNEPHAVQEAKSFVQCHLAEPLSMRAVAAHVNLNRHYFCKLFKHTTGMTFTTYLWEMRIQEAGELLKNPAKSIKDVAYAAGFRSVFHFDHVFRRLNGVSPTQFRANIGQPEVKSEQTK
jgi:AraC-like DNA-binding protein